MILIEPHIHMYSRTTNDYISMYENGIRVCVEPSFWLGSSRRYAGTFFDYFQLILEFETTRAARFGIDHFAAISLNPKETENEKLVNEVISGLQDYLDHPRCVALGEIGLNMITENEKNAFLRQMRIAEEKKMPVIIHLPHVPKKEGARIIVDYIKAEGFTQERIYIDHNDENTMSICRETACFCGLTVYPYSKLNPERVDKIIREFGAARMIVSGSADWGISDPIALVKVVDHLRTTGHSEEVIQKLTSRNADMFYSQSTNWKPQFDIEPVPVSQYQR